MTTTTSDSSVAASDGRRLFRARSRGAAFVQPFVTFGGIGLAVVVGLLTLALFLGETPWGLSPDLWLDTLTFAVVVGLGAPGYFAWRDHVRRRRLEERFPDFLRDIAVARRAGLTLVSAVDVAAEGDYGELTPEIRRMSRQLRWNVTFVEALQKFGQRVQTPLVERAINLIEEASRSGGSVTDVILAASRDARESRMLEEDRRMSMGLYVAIIYITFLVFLGVVGVMQGTFIPEILAAGEAASGSGAANVGGLDFSGVTLREYHTFYFLAALVQGVGNGIVAGIIETGKARAGFRHSVAMTLVAWGVFTFLVG